VKHPAIAGALQGFRYVLASQLLVLAVSIVKAFLIPLLLNVANYGYWQIYVFYTAYVGVFGLGFIDGIYLRYGGFDANALPIATVRSSLWVYTVGLLMLSTTMAWYVSLEADEIRRIVMYLVVANVLVMGLLGAFALTLQATNQFKQFSILNASDKLFFILLLPLLLLLRIDSVLWLAGADLVSKLVVLAVMFFRYRQLFIGVSTNLGAALREARENVKAGGQLMIANISGMLVLGMGRVIIEYFDKIETYAYYAFGISMTNLALVAISAFSVVIYPTLKRLPEANQLHFYNYSNRRLFIFNILMLGAYFPVAHLIGWMLPKYLPVIPYLNVLFAITVLQGKMQLLNNTYYKLLRRESAMLVANISSLLIVTLLSTAAYALSRKVEAIAYAALLTMVYRVYSSERYLRRQMGDSGSCIGIATLELAALTLFLTSTSLLGIDLALLSYVALLSGSLMYARDELTSSIRLISRKVR